jgi:hypothetical protein
MASHPRATKVREDSDGVRIETSGVRGRVWLLVAAMGLVVVALLLLARPGRHQRADEVAASGQSKPAAPASEAGRAIRPPDKPMRAAVAIDEPRAPSRPAREPTPASTQATEPSDEGAPAEEASGDAPMFGTGAPGEGIAVFPPPGTKPIKNGILVPEDFELPPGYVRHYQATDDGQRVPAILMFHPDYHPVDEHGAPIPLPADRIVPADMAPPGMPIEILQPPENQGDKAGAAGNPGAAP